MYFEGVVPALMTPFGEDGGVDADALARNAEWLLDNGAGGLVGTGTMGEAQSLSAAERRLVIETLVEAADGRVTVTAGVSSETPAASSAFAADAAAAGAGALMLLPPLGYHGDEREIEAFYRDVAGASGLPVMAYNNPKASGTDMLPDLVASLAANRRRRGRQGVLGRRPPDRRDPERDRGLRGARRRRRLGARGLLRRCNRLDLGRRQCRAA